MFHFAKSRIEQRIDYLGVPYEATVTTPIVKTRQQLWDEYRAIEKPEPLDNTGQHLPINEDAISNHFEIELLKQQK